jgi:hypothetical protein
MARKRGEGRVIINLVPDFMAVQTARDPRDAYRRYFLEHEKLLRAYWHNYVVEPESSHFDDIIAATVGAPRDDLHAALARIDLIALAREAEQRCRDLLEPDCDFDVVLMVGVGAANAGELVVDGRGIAFVCLEHFTGFANPAVRALGLDPELFPLWIAHEIAHIVRYTSPTSRSQMRWLIAEAGDFYSFWETGRRASLRELLVNEGVAVQAARLARPGHAMWEYFGYSRKEFMRVRELESAIARVALVDESRAGLGLRLRFLSGGVSARARTAGTLVLPERCGYYIGARTVEPAVVRNGIAWAARARAEELMPPLVEARTA